MTCQAFYQSVYKLGCVGIGETCEVCEPIPHLGLISLAIVCTGLLLIIISVHLATRKLAHKLEERDEVNKELEKLK